MNGFLNINQSNKGYLEHFIENLNEATTSFRYYSKRDMAAIYNHVITVLYFQNNEAVCYGHLDKEGNDIWLGIATLPTMQGKGLGNKMMLYLIENAKSQNINSIVLTVDNDNQKAIELYLKFGFVKEEAKDSYGKFRLNLL